MTRTTTALVLAAPAALIALLALSGLATAQLASTDDATGNGHDLFNCGNPPQVESRFDKFGFGFGDAPTCESSGVEFVNTQGRSGTLSVNFSEAAESRAALTVTLQGDLVWEVGIDATDDFFLTYTDNQVVSQLQTCTIDFTSTVPDTREFSLWYRIVPGGSLSDTEVEAAWYNDTGKVEEGLCTIETEPGSFSQEPEVWLNGAPDGAGGVTDEFYEMRFWDQTKGTGTLDSIADPTNPTAELEVDDDEEAVWFFERVPAETTTATILPTLIGQISDEIQNDQTFDVRLWGQTEKLEVLELNQAPNVTLVRAAPDGQIQWWNQSTEQVQVGLHAHQATQIGGPGTAWEVTFRNVTSGEWVVTANSTANVTGGGTENLTFSEPFTVDTGATVMTNDSLNVTLEGATNFDTRADELILIGLTVLAFWNGWVFAGAFPWVAAIGTQMVNPGDLTYTLGYAGFALGVGLELVAHRFALGRRIRGVFGRSRE